MVSVVSGAGDRHTALMFCTSCGASLAGGSFCSSCGAPAPAAAQPVVPALPVVPRPAWADAPTQRPPAPQPPQPPRKSRTGLMIGLLVVLLAGTLAVGGVVVWKAQDSEDRTTTSAPRDRVTPRSGSTPGGGAASSSPSAPPSAATASARCPDGSVIAVGARCRVDTRAAALAAFGLDAADCRASTSGSAWAGPVNMECLGGAIHVAIYADAAKRAARMSAYGFGSGGCEILGGGRVLCGPTQNGRYLRSYGNGYGILVYASSEGADSATLRNLRQLPADALLKGTRLP